MELNPRSATDIDDQPQVIRLKKISVDFIRTRPTSTDLELVFKDDAGVTYKSYKFKNGDLVRWHPNIYVKTHTKATLTIQRALFKIRVAEVSVEFKPYKFGDDKVIRLEDSDHRVAVTFVYTKSKSLANVTRDLDPRATFPNTVAPMDTQQPGRRIPEIKFRVLIIGRANAGKTSILQRICETTESPVIYRGMKEVRLDPSMDRGEHGIDDELMFSNHKGYVFHDSRGIESGGAEELTILQEFIRRKCGERRLADRLHAIWYCVPMDNQRPQLDLKFFKNICPDGNVPIVAVFTKYDQFLRNVQIYVEDFGGPGDNVSDVAEKQFEEHYLRALDDGVRFVRLEKMHKQNMGCDKLIETTAAALNDDIVGLMLLAVQNGNLALSVKEALRRIDSHSDVGVKEIVRECLIPFPHIWWEREERLEEWGAAEREFRIRRWRQWRLLGFFFQRDFERFLGAAREGFEEGGEFDEFRDDELGLVDHFTVQIMSLPTIRNLTVTGLGTGYHLILAVILILKHASLLCLSNMSPESALTHADVCYWDANIDSKIQQYLAAPQEHSDESFASFIMSTDFFYSSVETTFSQTRSLV